MTFTKAPLPKGKITIRFRGSRCMWQAYAGREYLNCASGTCEETAASALCEYFEVPAGTMATVYGYREPVTICVTKTEKQ